MEVILKQDFPSLGYVGDRVKVRGGYARNYLIPRGIALEASVRNGRLLQHRMTAIQAKRIKLRKQAEEFAEKMKQVKLQFTLKLGVGGKSFGSVTVRDLLPAIEKEGFALDRRQLRLPESVRGAGEYAVEVKLHSEVTVAIPFTVIAERPPKAESEEGEKKRKGARRGKKAAAEEGAEQTAEGDAETTEAAPEAAETPQE